MLTDIEGRGHTEVALRESEDRYRSLFNAIDAGFCIIEVKFDQTGRAIDYRFVEVNPGFESSCLRMSSTGSTSMDVSP